MLIPASRATRVLRLSIACMLGAVLLAQMMSCASLQRDVFYDAPAGEDPVELSVIELDLVRLRAEQGAGLRGSGQADASRAARLEAIRNRLTRLASVSSSDSRRTARIMALSAEAALLSGDKSQAARQLERSASFYGGDELAAIVASRLKKAPDERLEYLKGASRLVDEGQRIGAELGSAYYALGRMREALAAFDAALPGLAEEYTLLYGDERTRAYALRDAEVAPSTGSLALLTAEPLSLLGMAVLAQSETNAMDWMTGGATWAPGVLFDRLMASRWYLDTGAQAMVASTRKDAALFLWSMMSRADTRLATRYSTRYASRGTSPVPDVPYGSPYFDAALGLVEEDVMSLVDGKNFNPDGPVSGLDFYGWLQLAAAWR